MMLIATIFALQAAAPGSLEPIYACREIADRDARLACFDRAVGRLAETGADTAPPSRPDAPQVRFQPIDSTIASAGQDASGRWVFRLADGTRWSQITARTIGRPTAGQSARIDRGPIGGYEAIVNGRNWGRVRRAN